MENMLLENMLFENMLMENMLTPVNCGCFAYSLRLTLDTTVGRQLGCSESTKTSRLKEDFFICPRKGDT